MSIRELAAMAKSFGPVARTCGVRASFIGGGSTVNASIAIKRCPPSVKAHVSDSSSGEPTRRGQ